MSPTQDQKFKYVEDVKYKRNTSEYRRQMLRSYLIPCHDTSKKMAQARAGNVGHLHK
jgi:hypothetical protein